MEEYYENTFYGYRQTPPSSKLELVSVSDEMPDSLPDQAFFVDEQEINISPLLASLSNEEHDQESDSIIDSEYDVDDRDTEFNREELEYNPFNPALPELEIQKISTPLAPPPSLAASIEEVTGRRIDIGRQAMFPYGIHPLRRFSYFEGTSPDRNLPALWWNHNLVISPVTAAYLGGRFTQTTTSQPSNTSSERREVLSLNDQLPIPDALSSETNEEKGGIAPLLQKIGQLFKL